MGGGYRAVTLGEMDTPHPTERQKAKLPIHRKLPSLEFTTQAPKQR